MLVASAGLARRGRRAPPDRSFTELVALSLVSADARAELKASRVHILKAAPSAVASSATCTTARSSALSRSPCSCALLEKRLGEPDKAISAPAAPRLRPSWSRRSRSCASSLAACTRRCSPTVASRRRWRRSPRAPRCRCTWRACPTAAWPKPLEAAAYFVVAESLTRARSSTPRRPSSTCAWRPKAGELRVEIHDDGRGGADPTTSNGTGLRRPGRPRRGARRAPGARVPARGGHDRPRRAPG